MASRVTRDLNDRIKNDTFASVEFTFEDSLGAGIDLTGASIQVQFRFRCETGTILKDISVGSGITVTNAVNGVMEIDAFTPVAWAADTYFYDVEITLADTTINTYVEGTVKILQDTTN